ncbi:SDR family oxidoreductase [Bradyrhizobium sp.]|uniref:transglutaminase-like domain-containing protein n=1 Tax=Bradyrhizobium sp. TaxID=376 RepID=UPI0025BDC3B5|nr:SDR family oxidoreductase [Bradyrhizobium sp.]
MRDGIRYYPYVNMRTPETFRASSVLAAGNGYCVGKAALYTAACRVHDIPARIGFAEVHNHLTTEKLRQSMGALLAEKQPSLDFVSPAQLGGTVALLCSPTADQITGTTISVDGGWTAQ